MGSAPHTNPGFGDRCLFIRPLACSRNSRRRVLSYDPRPHPDAVAYMPNYESGVPSGKLAYSSFCRAKKWKWPLRGAAIHPRAERPGPFAAFLVNRQHDHHLTPSGIQECAFRIVLSCVDSFKESLLPDESQSLARPQRNTPPGYQ
jgi:hypothetical protein